MARASSAILHKWSLLKSAPDYPLLTSFPPFLHFSFIIFLERAANEASTRLELQCVCCNWYRPNNAHVTD